MGMSRLIKMAVLPVVAFVVLYVGLIVQENDFRIEKQPPSSKDQRSVDPLIEQKELYIQDNRLHIARNLNLSYVHIPKTGGTTVEESSLFDHKRRHGIAPRSHHSVRRLSNATGTDDYLVATHIRDPCDRFMSAFLYLRFDPRSQGMHKDAQEFGLFNFQTVEQFVAWLDKTQSWDTLALALPHFAPMTNWLVHDDGSFGVDIVMCQEDWNEGVERLIQQLHLDWMPQNLLFRKRKNEAHTRSCSDLNPPTSSRIMEEYAVDACLFGYGMYGTGEWAMEGRNDTLCVGAQYNRSWFSNRLGICKEKVSRSQRFVILD